MAEALKDQYGPEVAETLAARLKAVYPDFDQEHFLTLALQGYDELDLMARGRHIAAALKLTLPADYQQAIQVLTDSLGGPLIDAGSFGMSAFFYLPHTQFVAAYGLDDFDTSMQAQYLLTQRFTAEFSIRPFIERYPDRVLTMLREWAGDESEHVRRLVSEGTRPRLPWAPRLRQFARNPAPVIELLELLKDDSSLYVRRSVANHLNDLGKDHPELLIDISRQWMQDASPERQWLVRHALRSAVKRCDVDALEILGYGSTQGIKLKETYISPDEPNIGEAVRIKVTLANQSEKPVPLMADFRIQYVKANGQTRPKVFKLKSGTLEAGESMTLEKQVSLAQMSTRKHYPGHHQVELQLNGTMHDLGSFNLQ